MKSIQFITSAAIAGALLVSLSAHAGRLGGAGQIGGAIGGNWSGNFAGAHSFNGAGGMSHLPTAAAADADDNANAEASRGKNHAAKGTAANHASEVATSGRGDEASNGRSGRAIQTAGSDNTHKTAAATDNTTIDVDASVHGTARTHRDYVITTTTLVYSRTDTRRHLWQAG